SSWCSACPPGRRTVIVAFLRGPVHEAIAGAGDPKMGIRTVFMFLVGTTVGYCVLWYYVDLLGLFAYRPYPLGPLIAAAGAIVFGWLAYAAVFDIADREGGKGMTMIFIFAPAAGAVIGLIAAGLLARPNAPDLSAGAANPPPSR